MKETVTGKRMARSNRGKMPLSVELQMYGNQGIAVWLEEDVVYPHAVAAPLAVHEENAFTGSRKRNNLRPGGSQPDAACRDPYKQT